MSKGKLGIIKESAGGSFLDLSLFTDNLLLEQRNTWNAGSNWKDREGGRFAG